MGDYVPLRAHSHYSFLDSTLSPVTIVELAQRHHLTAVALTDHGNLHGAVEFVQAAQQAGLKPIVGAELRVGEQPLLLYVASARGYRNLCGLLSRHTERVATGTNETAMTLHECCPSFSMNRGAPSPHPSHRWVYEARGERVPSGTKEPVRVSIGIFRPCGA